MGTMQVCETRFFFSGQNSQLDGEILFCPDVSAGHFQKLFRALCTYSSYTQIVRQITIIDVLSHKHV